MTYNNTSDFAAAQIRAFNDLKNVDIVLRTALFDSLVLIKDRIQQSGQKADGSDIGKYSTTSGGGSSKSFSGIANKKQQKAQSGKGFQGGYAAFRSKLGRQVAFVDLTLSGDMMRDFTIIPDGSDALGLGFNSDLQSKKAEGNEEHFGGAIFELTDKEEKFITGEIERKVLLILSNA